MYDILNAVIKMKYQNVIDLVKSTKEIVFSEEKLAEIQTKGYADFVTGVDLAVQTYIQGKLSEMYPDVQFMGEEGGKSKLDFSGKIWILDPIDGTSNLIHHLNMSAVSLALVENNKPVFGVVYNPFTDELFTAEKGKGAYYNGKAIYVSDKKTMKESFVSVGTSPYDEELREKSLVVIANLLRNCTDIRRMGAASLDLAYIAMGKFDCFYEEILRPWDYAAGAILIEEAGGKITDLDGNVLSFETSRGILASNGCTHNELMKLIKV